MRIKAQILQRFLRTRDESSQRAEGLGECAVNKRNAVFHAKFLSRAATMFAACQHRVGFINKNAGAVRLCDVNQLPQITEIAVHGINAFHDNELPPAFLASERRVQGNRIVVLEFLCAASGKHCPIAKTEVRAVVQNRHVRFTKQPGTRTECTTKSAVEKHRILEAEKIRNPPLKFPM